MSNSKESVEVRALREWKNNPEIVKEFNGDLSAYVAFLKNSEAGRVQIIGNKSHG